MVSAQRRQLSLDRIGRKLENIPDLFFWPFDNGRIPRDSCTTSVESEIWRANGRRCWAKIACKEDTYSYKRDSDSYEPIKLDSNTDSVPQCCRPVRPARPITDWRSDLFRMRHKDVRLVHIPSSTQRYRQTPLAGSSRRIYCSSSAIIPGTWYSVPTLEFAWRSTYQ